MALDKCSNQDIGHVLFQHLFHAWSVSHDINSSLARGHAFNQHLRFARELAGWYQNATNTQNSESDKVAHFQGWAVVNSRREKGYKRGRPGNCDLTGQTQTDDCWAINSYPSFADRDGMAGADNGREGKGMKLRLSSLR
jgi:hypothetical protein